MHGAQTDAGLPGGMLREVSEYILEIRPLTLPQQIAGEQARLNPLITTMGLNSDITLRFQRLLEISTALSAERDQDRLLEQILLRAMELTAADGGTLYTLGRNDMLEFAILRNHSLGLCLGGTSSEPVQLPPIPLYDDRGQPNERTVAAYAALKRQVVNLPDVYQTDRFDFTGTMAFDRNTGYWSEAILAVPMQTRSGELLGVLQLINPIDTDTRQVRPFSGSDEQLLTAFASQAAVALENAQLIDQLTKLLEHFIDAIAWAIDEKSPYTGGHCRRVPELAMMFAEALSHHDEGPYRDFSFSQEQLYEFRIAALLHDCGKITTPVHVVDKATKLQTLFDRIALIDMRFEILIRDRQLAMLQRRLDAAVQDRAAMEQGETKQLAEEIETLNAERRFLHRINRGSEFMSDEDVARVQRIASRHWSDHRGREQPLLSEDEVNNLTIRKGTLNTEERRIINNHIVASIKMLESMSFPRHLANVPEIAGGHHERIDGKGYPRGLTGDQMSVPARMLAIVDVFEALTAHDRPYKPAMKLSQSLAILKDMAASGHLDPDLYEVFVRSRIYERYAQAFLAPEQIDEVNREELLEAPLAAP